MDDYEGFVRSARFPWCWACGRDETQRPSNWHAPWYLQRAHIASGSGKMTRKQDARQVNILCPRCHMLHGGARFKEPGGYLPQLSNENMLWLKGQRDAERYDRGYLESHWTGKLPEPEEPPGWFMEEYSRNHPYGTQTPLSGPPKASEQDSG